MFSDYETFGDLFRDIRDGLLELTFIERLLLKVWETSVINYSNVF